MKCPECDKTNFEMTSPKVQTVGENADLPIDDSAVFKCKECGYEDKWNRVVMKMAKKEWGFSFK